jgi:hypothetical protein
MALQRGIACDGLRGGGDFSIFFHMESVAYLWGQALAGSNPSSPNKPLSTLRRSRMVLFPYCFVQNRPSKQ